MTTRRCAWVTSVLYTGYLRDTFDSRDHQWGIRAGMPVAPAPARHTLESLAGPAWDQGPTFECVAWAAAGLKRIHEFKQSGRILEFDAPGLYRKCKEIDGHSEAQGTFIRAAMKVMASRGIKGSDGLHHHIGEYVRLTSHSEIQHAVSRGGAVMLGIMIDKDGWIDKPYPFVAEPGGSKEYGHCVLVVGYDDTHAAYRIRNSWGPFWAEYGHCWLPYDYLKYDSMFDAWSALDKDD